MCLIGLIVIKYSVKVLFLQYNLISLFSSTKQDDLFIVHIQNEYSSLLESVFKTEFLTTLNKRYKERVQKNLHLECNDALVMTFILIVI